MRVRVAGLDQPILVLSPLLQCARDILFGFGAPGIEHLRLDIQSTLVTDVESSMQDSTVAFKGARLFFGEHFSACLVLRVVEQVAIQLLLEVFEVFITIDVVLPALLVLHRRCAIGKLFLLSLFYPLDDFTPLWIAAPQHGRETLVPCNEILCPLYSGVCLMSFWCIGFSSSST